MILNLYTILSSLIFFIILPIIYIARILQKKDVTSFNKKFGNFELESTFDKNKKTILIHGVSVGEIVSLEKLIRKIREKFPDFNIVITTGTKTGQEVAHKKMSDVADFITYFPFDIKSCVDKFLNKLNPNLVLIAETEIWPVFVNMAYKKNIPVFIINGRMSDESFKMYKLLKPFFKNVFSKYTKILTQSELDKKRLELCGADLSKLEVMKNLKFDIEKFDVDIDLKKENSKVLIAGSTHKTEEEIVLFAYKKLKEKCKNLKLILAPRHITRTLEVEELIKKEGLKYNLYSKKPEFLDVDIILLDVMGELAKLYYTADVAFIGGSFNKTGGHNPLEAVVFGKPAITGPSIKNFRDIYSILSSNNAGFIVKNKEEFYNILEKLFLDNDFYEKIAQNSKSVFLDQQGGLDYVINKIGEIFK